MSKIKRYIEGEKEISRFRLNALKRLNKPYSKRLIEKEKRFLKFNFSSCNFKDIEEAREALDLFRSSERDFYISYGFESNIENFNFEEIKEFLRNKKSDVLCNKFSYLDYSSRRTTNSDGAIKKVICDRNMLLSDFISHFIKNIYFIKNEISYSSIKSNVIKSMFDDGDINNVYNLFELYADNLSLERKTKITNLLYFPFEHSGNEKITPIASRIKTPNKTLNILKFNNIKKNGKYFKALKIIDENVRVLDDIDLEDSYCLVFKTRRATESFMEIEKNIKIIIKELSSKFDIKIAF